MRVACVVPEQRLCQEEGDMVTCDLFQGLLVMPLRTQDHCSQESIHQVHSSCFQHEDQCEVQLV